MRILATGGAGYVGSHAVRWLERAGHEVWIYDDLSRGHREFARPDRLVVGALANQELLTRTLVERRIEAVVHFAAFALVGESVADPGLYYRNNALGSLCLFDSMRAADVKRVVVSSTTAVFGAPERMPIAEDELRMACNPYGRSKVMMEEFLEDYCAAYGFAATALRYFNASGAAPDASVGEWHDPETRLIPLVLGVALGVREKIVIFGDDYPTRDGSCVRDYVHVDDLAAAHLAALDRLEPGKFRAYNLGNGRGYSNFEVVDSCRRISGRPIRVEIGPRRAGDPPTLIADSTRARAELGWTPQYQEIDSIVSTAWRWHVKMGR